MPSRLNSSRWTLSQCVAFPAERHHRGGIAKIRLGLALGAVVLFLDLPFDRQAVAVPARHVIGIEAQHLLALGHDVLEDLVERMPDMDVAVGVGRAVMQHEFRSPGGVLAQPVVEADLVPASQDFRLAFGQAGAHREFRLRQEQGLGIVGNVGLLRLFGHECSGLAQGALKRDRFADEFRGIPVLRRAEAQAEAGPLMLMVRRANMGLSIAAGRENRKAPLHAPAARGGG